MIVDWITGAETTRESSVIAVWVPRFWAVYVGHSFCAAPLKSRPTVHWLVWGDRFADADAISRPSMIIGSRR